VTDQIGRDGIFLNTNEYNFTFDGNSWHDIGRTDGQALLHFDHGIYSYGHSMTIINNIFYNMTRGWSVQTANGAHDWVIANNTFAFANANNASGQIELWNDNSNISIQNNIFYQPLNYAIERFVDPTNPDGSTKLDILTGCTVNYNIVYGASNVTMMNPTYSRDCTIDPPFPQGTNKIGMNPSLVNTSTSPYDFHLQGGSPAIDAGVTLTQVTTQDFDGITRPQGSAYDMGAYEFIPGGAPAFLTGYALNSPPLRNDFSGFAGMQFTVGSNALSVSALGRIFVTGNSGTHTVKLVQTSNGADVPGGSVSVSMTGGVAGQFKYVALGSPCRPTRPITWSARKPAEAINGTTPAPSPPPMQGR
jgi:hypothetical protein